MRWDLGRGETLRREGREGGSEVYAGWARGDGEVVGRGVVGWVNVGGRGWEGRRGNRSDGGR